jgi:MFS family permease
MWTWIPTFLAVAFATSAWAPAMASFVAFGAIGIGGLGSYLAGYLADRWGRSRTTILSMTISGTCALVIGAAIPLGPAIVTVLALVWGFAIVADSAQFSTSVSELAEPEYMGTMHDADHTDRARIPADDGDDPPASSTGGLRGMAVGLCPAGAWSGTGLLVDVAPAALTRRREAGGGAGVMGGWAARRQRLTANG